MLQLSNGFVKAALAVVENTEIVVSVPIVRAQRDSFLVSGFGVGDSPRTFVRMSDADESIRIPGIKLHRALKLLQRQVVFPSRIMDAAEGHINHRQPVIELRSLAAICERFVRPFWVAVERIFQTIGLAKLRVSQGKSGIGLECTVERIESHIEVARLVVALQVTERLEVGLVRSGISAAPGSPPHLRSNLDAHEFRQA